MSKQKINLNVNGQAVTAEAEPRELLIHVLREQLQITGPHIGCETTHCGACTVETVSYTHLTLPTTPYV